MTKVININEPIVWETYDNIKILDIPQDQLEYVKNYITVQIIAGQLLYRNSQIIGALAKATIDDLLRVITILLQDRISLIAIDENTNDVIGAIVLKVMEKDFHTWTEILKLPQSNILKTIFQVDNFMLKKFNENTKNNKIEYYLNAFFVCTSPNYCGLKLKTKLLLAAERVAASMRIPYLTTVAYSYNNQKRFLRARMIEAYRIYYALYKDQDGNRPFDIKLKREWYCILFIKHVIPQTPYTEL